MLIVLHDLTCLSGSSEAAHGRGGDHPVSSSHPGDGGSGSGQQRQGRGLALPLGVDPPEESAAEEEREDLPFVEQVT